MKTGLIEHIQKEIKGITGKHHYHVMFAYLFGSLATQNTSTSSDIDIGVYLEKDFGSSSFDIKLSLYMELARALKRNDIDIVVMNQCNNIILLNKIMTHGTVLHDTDQEFRLSYEQMILHRAIDFKSQRKMAMGV